MRTVRLVCSAAAVALGLRAGIVGSDGLNGQDVRGAWFFFLWSGSAEM